MTPNPTFKISTLFVTNTSLSDEIDITNADEHHYREANIQFKAKTLITKQRKLRKHTFKVHIFIQKYPSLNYRELI